MSITIAKEFHNFQKSLKAFLATIESQDQVNQAVIREVHRSLGRIEFKLDKLNKSSRRT